MGTIILSCGTKGKRHALPNATIHIHQPLGGAEGQASDIEITAQEILRLKDMLAQLLSKNTKQTKNKILKDFDRDFFMTAKDAKTYGIIDTVTQSK
jgi:ATP-dependent Clp protease protease subunit